MEFDDIKSISKNVDNKTLIIFWQFAIKSLNELDVVSNQNLSIEMFLIRLMYLVGTKDPEIQTKNNDVALDLKIKKDDKQSLIRDTQIDQNTISQIKNVSQQKEISSKIIKNENKKINEEIKINSFNDLIDTCFKFKEMKLKYELENNVNLVKFEYERIEISFNEKLDKNFIKELSAKLFEWTSKRWIITLSKTEGSHSVKEQKKINKDNNKRGNA